MSTEETKECPFCAETIKTAAVVCKHCGRDLAGDNNVPSKSTAYSPPKKKSGTNPFMILVLVLVGLCVIMFFVVNNLDKGKPLPEPEAALLVCQDCADAGININLWSSPERLKIVGSVPHLTTAVIIDTAQQEEWKLYRVRANNINGWITEDFVKKVK